MYIKVHLYCISMSQALSQGRFFLTNTIVRSVLVKSTLLFPFSCKLSYQGLMPLTKGSSVVLKFKILCYDETDLHL